MNKKFNDKDSAVTAIIDSAKKHAVATESGDYKIANKNYQILNKSISYLIESNKLEELRVLLTYDDVSVKVWVASYLIKLNDKNAIATLKEIAKKSIPHHSFAAELVLENWKKKMASN